MSTTEGSRPDDYPHLASPFRAMKAQYDVVVVGSGYGAGVAASRMARAGKSVAVLELGWERRPGSFPRSLFQCLGDLNISGISRWRLPDKPTRLFQLILGDGQHALVARALGGCSLINAGVFLEADRETLQMSVWPPEIRNDTSALRPYYSRAADMLQPSPYPEDHPPLLKLEAIQIQAEWMGKVVSFYRTPLTTFFRRERNHVGVMMQENHGSGNESTGLNDGSKNTVSTTYLTDAWNWGAEIFCGCEVRYIEQAPNQEGYVVYFAWHGRGRSAFGEEVKTQLFWVKATELCFLGAGALGTTEILLRSRDYGLPTSPMVGRNMSGNGDMLVFGYNSDSKVNGISEAASGPANRPGPTVTGVVDRRGLSPGDALAGYVIEDGCIPKALSPLIQIMLVLQTIRLPAPWSISESISRFGETISKFKLLPFKLYKVRGAMQRTSTYLVMSHDSNELTLTLKDDRPILRGPGEGQSENFSNIRYALSYVISRAGGKIGSSLLRGREQEEVTVHPLGGANMSSNCTGRGGVTNHLGQVYKGHGSATHEGLVCCDASVIPTALGVNPMATITALSERSIDLIAKKRQFSIDTDTPNGRLDIYSQPMVSRRVEHGFQKTAKVDQAHLPIGWQFSEVLDGHIYMHSNDLSADACETLGRSSSCTMRMFLTIEICRRMDTLGLQYEGICTGTVACRGLSRGPMRVVDGKIRFFVPSKKEAESTALRYSLQLLSVEDFRYKLEGYKEIDSTSAFSIRGMWEATTKVKIHVTRDDGLKVGAGVLRISWPSFRRQMKTFRTVEPFRLGLFPALVLFLAYFTLQLAVVFLRPLAPARKSRHSPQPHPGPKQQPFNTTILRTKDGVTVRLEEYEPLPNTNEAITGELRGSQPVLFIPGVTGNATHSTFALPYLRCNMVEYFTARACRCYVLTPRWGSDTKISAQCTVYDCRLEIAAALQHILDQQKQKPYIVAHCQGSVALAMGLLDGTINRTHILGITANAVFMTQVLAYWNSVKAATPALIRLYEFISGTHYPIGSPDGNKPIHKVLDILLRFYPVENRRDICTSTHCHRTTFAFGLCWNHNNLDTNIHDNVGQFFADTHTKLLEHVTRMGTHGACLDNELRPLLTDRNLRNLQDIPILFMSGTVNEVFKPESTLRDYEMLRRRFGEHLYRRFLVEGYGHLDPVIGKNAADDVYWRVFEHVKWCVQGQRGAKN
ncbi:FAD/NAD(P)-binding domain-containing protein [Aspergillus vadensis CBS 113365]|uniref:Cholesterol oxidase n=1 Tax=Aspergillus vadensis (strain CBS 113365 / IMI 142717 / IBT 24658) TaxID=1448311 RepID=A0A319CBS5_ASPVC|nr:FAD/NAD(P)-binding domain-containing protein [Aspergillus vadensis CBS 113365]PYH65952.1 FAD/NAD(P)-binding domain-containing protein [Aspergillus vadensis CBS 113365]